VACHGQKKNDHRFLNKRTGLLYRLKFEVSQRISDFSEPKQKFSKEGKDDGGGEGRDGERIETPCDVLKVSFVFLFVPTGMRR
jgi:hypothetical protein